MEKDSKKHVPLVAYGHEFAQIASRLAEDAREIEKCGDTVNEKSSFERRQDKNQN